MVFDEVAAETGLIICRMLFPGGAHPEFVAQGVGEHVRRLEDELDFVGCLGYAQACLEGQGC